MSKEVVTTNDHIFKEVDFKGAEELVSDVKKDLARRQKERKIYESQWRLNMNFIIGNQYCAISQSNEVINFDRRYEWQEREVYNHIASVVEIRQSKLNAVRPKMQVLPSSGDVKDVATSKMSSAVLEATRHKLALNELISEATTWSEATGSCFYKVVWNKDKGRLLVGEPRPLYEGEVEISVVPPFEVFPYSSNIMKLEDNPSIIHAKAFPVSVIKSNWGIEVDGEDIDVYSLGSTSVLSGMGYTQNIATCASALKENHALVIERYELPSVNYPNGRLVIVIGDKLVYAGDLPFINGTSGERGYPFIKQTCISVPGQFWGVSVVERCIPVQRAYNALKNRKQEFLNRTSMGVLMVEDGACDVDNLEEEGLTPGKVVVYRQGANPPTIMSASRIPVDFATEEARLLSEFSVISGVSELMRQSALSLTNMSGTAIQLLIEQDSSRLSCTIDSIKFACIEIAKHILKLYKQFAFAPRLARVMGDKNSVEVISFNGSELSSEDIICDSEAEVLSSKSQQKSTIMELLSSGLLADENGKISNSNRIKILQMLGLGFYDGGEDISAMQIKSAQRENMNFMSGVFDDVEEYDDHEVHIKEHTAFMLSSDGLELKKDKALKEKVLKHIRTHKQFNKLTEV